MTNLKAVAVQHFSVAPDAVYAALLDPAFIRRFLFGDLLREEEILSIVARTLGVVDLEDAIGKMPSELSGGMRRRAAIALACRA